MGSDFKTLKCKDYLPFCGSRVHIQFLRRREWGLWRVESVLYILGSLCFIHFDCCWFLSLFCFWSHVYLSVLVCHFYLSCLGKFYISYCYKMLLGHSGFCTSGYCRGRSHLSSLIHCHEIIEILLKWR